MEISPILRCTFLHQYLDFLLAYYTHRQFKIAVGYLFLTPMLMDKCASPFVSFFWVWLQPKKYASIFRSLITVLHLGTHPSETGKELIYYYLYHEEASFTCMSVINSLTVLYKKSLKIKIIYNDTTYLFLYLYTTLY